MSQTATERLSLLRQAATDAVGAAQALRDRVRGGDSRVTARQLSDADSAIELANLRAEAAEREAVEEQEAERVRALHEAADRYAADEPAALQAFADALAGLEQALQVVRQTADAHRASADAMRRAARALGASERVQPNSMTGEVAVDGHRVRDVTTAEHVRRLVEAAERTIAPRFEGRSLWPEVPVETRPDDSKRRPVMPWERPPVAAVDAAREEQEQIRRWNAERSASNAVHTDRLAVIHPGTTGGITQ